MLALTDREWKEFSLTDIFSIKTTSSSIDKIKLNKTSGEYPYITRADSNNGINDFVCEQDGYSTDAGNCITVGLDTQTAFYQKTAFYTGQNIQVLRNRKLNETNAKFFLPLLKITLSVFNWGGNGATLTRLKRSKIILPVTDDGKPDYAFMEQYIREREQQVIQNYIAYIGKNISTGGGITPLNQKEWKEFYLHDIFPNIRRGKRLKTADHIAGSVPYVSSSAETNGVDAFIGNTGRIRKFSDCLTIANSGSVGKAFYHRYEFIASDHVTALSSPCLNEYSYLFVSVIVERLQEKYSFNREINDVRINKEKIILPVTDDGTPDYSYMEQYVKRQLDALKLRYLQEKAAG